MFRSSSKPKIMNSKVEEAFEGDLKEGEEFGSIFPFSTVTGSKIGRGNEGVKGHHNLW